MKLDTTKVEAYVDPATGEKVTTTAADDLHPNHKRVR